jgi:small subunit ribosomal protein S21
VSERKREVDELGYTEVRVDRDNVSRAISQLKRLMAREGVLKELKNRRFYEKPSIKDKRKRREAERRRRKDARKARQQR